MAPPSGDYIILSYWYSIDSLEDWLIAGIERVVKHATIEPAAKHASIERWSFTDGLLRRAEGIENVPLYGRRYDPGRHLAMVRRYVLDDLEPERVRLIWHNAQRIMLGRLYDFPGLLTCAYYLWRGRPDRIWQSHHASLYCQEGVCATLRASNIPMLSEFRVGIPPMIVSPDSTAPCTGETWTAHLYPSFEEWCTRYGIETPR